MVLIAFRRGGTLPLAKPFTGSRLILGGALLLCFTSYVWRCQNDSGFLARVSLSSGGQSPPTLATLRIPGGPFSPTEHCHHVDIEHDYVLVASAGDSGIMFSTTSSVLELPMAAQQPRRIFRVLLVVPIVQDMLQQVDVAARRQKVFLKGTTDQTRPMQHPRAAKPLCRPLKDPRLIEARRRSGVVELRQELRNQCQPLATTDIHNQIATLKVIGIEDRGLALDLIVHHDPVETFAEVARCSFRCCQTFIPKMLSNAAFPVKLRFAEGSPSLGRRSSAMRLSPGLAVRTRP